MNTQLQASCTTTNTLLILSAADLWRKSGFEDGDAVLNFCIEHDIDLLAVPARDVLVHLVREQLVPAVFQEVELEEYVGSHNPIRVKGWDADSSPACADSVFVALTKAEVIAGIHAVLSATRADRALGLGAKFAASAPSFAQAVLHQIASLDHVERPPVLMSLDESYLDVASRRLGVPASLTQSVPVDVRNDWNRG